MRSRFIFVYILSLASSLLTGCGGTEDTATDLIITNGTQAVLSSIALTIGPDTFTVESLACGSSAEWIEELESAERAILRWTAAGEDFRFEAALVEEAESASVMVFYIPTGDAELSISYHF